MTLKPLRVVDNTIPENKYSSQQQSNGGNGGDDGMKELERRVTNLETNVQTIRDDIHTLKKDVAVINTHLEYIAKNMATKTDVSEIKNMASKADLSDAKMELTRWMIATMLGGVGTAAAIVFGIMRIYPSQPSETHVQLVVPDKAIQVVVPDKPAKTPDSSKKLQ